MTGFISVMHQVSNCCCKNRCSKLDIQNISGTSKRVPVAVATVYITWVSFFTTSLVLSIFSSLRVWVIFNLSLCFPWFFFCICLIPFSLFQIYFIRTVWHILDIHFSVSYRRGRCSIPGQFYGFRMERSVQDDVISENSCIPLPVSILLLLHIHIHSLTRHCME